MTPTEGRLVMCCYYARVGNAEAYTREAEFSRIRPNPFSMCQIGTLRMGERVQVVRPTRGGGGGKNVYFKF
jgi:hypothetical protein